MAKRAVAKPRATGVQLGEDVARNMVMFGATRVFVTMGYRNASVEDLLEAGQVSRRTFYRFFKSKDDVALALYTFGTATLLDNARKAIAQEGDFVEHLERLVDLHLNNVGRMGRLIYVLGGEAARLESPLYLRRMEVHDAIADMIHALPAAGDSDPWVTKTIMFAIEAMVRNLLHEGDEGRRVTDAMVERARKVLRRIVSATALASGARIAPMPTT
jgi:AcrR family transcriptional regulator